MSDEAPREVVHRKPKRMVNDSRAVYAGKRQLGVVLELLSGQAWYATWYPEEGHGGYTATRDHAIMLLRILDAAARHAGDLDATIAALEQLRAAQP